MTKLYCPIENCHESNFGVSEPHQVHVNLHLRDVHGITVTNTKLAEYRQRQDEAWQARYDKLELERANRVKHMKEEYDAFVNDPSLPTPCSILDDDIEKKFSDLMETYDDKPSEDDANPAEAAAAKAASERFENAPGYDVSYRRMNRTTELLYLVERSNEMLAHNARAGNLQQQPTYGGENQSETNDGVKPPKDEDSAADEKISPRVEPKSKTPAPIRRATEPTPSST